MANSDDHIIRIKNLCNRFGEQTVHDGLDLDVRRGEILGVVGGSGTGKSVLMRSIIGLQTPEAGEVEVFGEPTLGRDETETLDIRRRWGVLFQGGALFSTLTVAENVQVPLREFYPDLDLALLDEIASYKVVMTGLPADAGPKYPAELSGGMRKRAGLARALALDPELLFLDEPTAGLDPIGAAAFDQLTQGLQRTLGLTVFLITHDLDTLYAICDRVAVLADKKVIAVGTIPELLATDHPWIQEYFNGPRGRAAVDAQQKAGDKMEGQARSAVADAAAHPTEVARTVDGQRTQGTLADNAARGAPADEPARTLERTDAARTTGTK
ncbi:ABC transporter ATP-binding protein [uncultured Sphingomonas sp.]|uniref:ABC transporter ATP-binding protein n=1 Tax=uncultured Sphingomonas sp. TaxID=158754 RepID=UPI0025ED22E4|nr:ABC transporter ATP-binding protein [uncultured Sphingomonas sp.]